MPAVIEAGAVLALAALPGRRHLLTLAAPATSRLVGPGQFAMLRSAGGLDPCLRRPLPFLNAQEGSVSFLFSAGEQGLARLARRLGDTLSLVGPLGRGFALQPGTRRLLLVAVGEPLAPLLALASCALAAGPLEALQRLARGLAGLRQGLVQCYVESAIACGLG